ncbi:hypothetical protein FFWV33_02505 [Flavobacterium faecale]|uniref:Molecular chaperone n=1 Tax=Flavobacterium faecale TaxID=1355330 RepID=A0A2S1L9P7_9FLAO|nr:hypothetical protein [Flavobacterium faecale]AWG20479.1 hypothetical protein FFWV33_02505 [Flavobacterium faecale]
MTFKLQLFLLFFTIGMCGEVYAQGDLLITPNRVIFEGRKLKEELNLINSGTETTTFSVSFVQRRMKEDGSFEVVTTEQDGQQFADPYLRIYPRQVTLRAGEAQVVMLQCRRKPDMEAGEYRSHLYFRSEKNYEALGTKTKDTSRVVSVNLIPIFGMSIPIIVRSGDTKAIASITDLKFNNLKEELSLSCLLKRSGNASVYGDLKVEYISDRGKITEIGGLKGVGVYTEIDKRTIRIPLEKKATLQFDKGKLKVSYTARADARSPEVYAEAVLQL